MIITLSKISQKSNAATESSESAKTHSRAQSSTKTMQKPFQTQNTSANIFVRVFTAKRV